MRLPDWDMTPIYCTHCAWKSRSDKAQLGNVEGFPHRPVDVMTQICINKCAKIMNTIHQGGLTQTKSVCHTPIGLLVG